MVVALMAVLVAVGAGVAFAGNVVIQCKSVPC
jgi:hypothetical protein